VKRGVALHPEAKLEIRRAVRWYRSRNPNIAAKFTVAIHAAIKRIADNPYQFPETQQQTRRAFTNGFPYELEFRMAGERAVVTGCRHYRQNPRRWGGEE
jgi:plasmid stabilization system protein ParE